MRYFLLSATIPAHRLLHVVRAHWTTENSLHCMFDVVMNEDHARNRADHGPRT